MIERRAVVRYAQALFGLAEKQGVLDRVEQEFLAASQLAEKHPEISHLVRNSTIALAEKEDFIDKLVGSESSPLLVNFLKVLVKKKRFTELGDIREEFHRLYEKKKGLQEVEAVTAVPLAKETEDRLRSALKKRLNAEIRLVLRTDPSLLGGLVLRFDGTEMNASFRARLDELKLNLIS